MEVKASLKYLKISPRKVRLVTELIKSRNVEDALDQLQFIPKRSSRPILKLLESAIANAKHNFHLDRSNLYIKNIKVDVGPSLKRWTARARGSASPILKRSSHVSLVLAERHVGKNIEIEEENKEKEVKKVRVSKPEMAKPRGFEEIKPKRIIAKQKMFRRKAI